MVKTMGVESAQEFLSLLEKSAVLEPEKLEEVKTSMSDAADAKTVARLLLKNQMLSKWQAVQLMNGMWQLCIGKYRMIEVLGEGRIGREMLAEHQHLGRRVALKIVSRKLTSDPSRLKRFLAESRRVMAIDHPNLIHSFDVDHEGDRYFLVTEYVPGENLQQRVTARGPLEVNEAAEIIRQAAEGLKDAADQKVHHGDLQPVNLVVDRLGVLKVVELGIARLVEGTPGILPADDQGIDAGSDFQAPEITTAGDHPRITSQADMFALGQILYFSLTGKQPGVPAETFDERKAALQAELPQAPENLLDCLATMIAPDPHERFEKWTQVLTSLQSIPRHELVKEEKKAIAVKQEAPKPEPAKQAVAATKAAPPPVKRPPVKQPAVSQPAVQEKTAPEKVTAAAPPPRKKNGVAAKPIVETTVVEEVDEVAGETAESLPSAPSPFSINVGGKKPSDSSSRENAVAAPAFSIDPGPKKGAAKKAEPPKKPEAEKAQPEKKGAPAAASLQETKKDVLKKTKQEDSAANDVTEASTEGEDKPTPSKKKSKKLDPRVAIGIVAGGGVALLLITILILYFALGGIPILYFALGGGKKADAVAKAEPVAEAIPNEADPDAAPNPPGAEDKKKEEPPGEFNPEEVNPGDVAPNPTPAAESVPGDKAALPDKPADEAPKTDPSAPTPDPANPAPMPNPMPAENANPPGEAPKSEPAPEAPKTGTPPAKPAKNETPAPMATSAAKTPASTNIANPFDEMPKDLDLPAVSAESHALGKVKLGPTQTVLIYLHGGETAARSKQQFTLEAAVGAQTVRDWDVKLSGKPGEEAKKIATLKIEGDQLKLQWSPEAAEDPSVPYLKNCLLEMSSGKQSAKLALRKPVELDPMKFDLEKNGSAKIPLDFTPDAKLLRVQILKANDLVFPNSELKPAEPLDASKGTTQLWFGPAADKRTLGLKIDVSGTTKSLEIRTQPYFRTGVIGEEAVRLTPKALSQREQYFKQGSTQMAANKGNAEKQINSGGMNEERKKQAIAVLEQQIKDAEATSKSLTETLGLFEQVKANEMAVLHYRVVYDTAAGKVVIAETKGAPSDDDKPTGKAAPGGKAAPAPAGKK